MKGPAMTPEDPSDFISHAVASIARQLAPLAAAGGPRGAPPPDTGLQAVLRRFDPVTQRRACLYQTTQVLINAGVDDHIGGADAERLQQRWAVLVHALALARGAHQPGGRNPGAALASQRFSELRLRQLLQADEALLLQLMPTLARRLAAAGAAVDWLPLALLLLFADIDEARADRARAWIAAGYLREARTGTQQAADPSTDDTSQSGSPT